MSGPTAIRLGLVGCGRRAVSVYLPVILQMGAYFEVTALCDRSVTAIGAARECLARPVWTYAMPSEMLTANVVDAAVICVSPPPSSSNGEVLLECIEAGLPALAETPIANTLAEAERVLAALERRRVSVQIAENYSRRPWERAKRMLIDAGVFGRILYVHADFVAHGYHAISVIRNHIGYSVPIRRVAGFSQDHKVMGHRHHDKVWTEDELLQIGLIEFADGGSGLWTFSTIAYHSPLRWQNKSASVRFHGQRGMGYGQRLCRLSEDGQIHEFELKAVLGTVRGKDVLQAYQHGCSLAPHWENPLRHLPLTDHNQHDGLTIGLQLLNLHGCVTTGESPEYSVHDAYIDRKLDLAVNESWVRDCKGLFTEVESTARTPPMEAGGTMAT